MPRHRVHADEKAEESYLQHEKAERPKEVLHAKPDGSKYRFKSHLLEDAWIWVGEARQEKASPQRGDSLHFHNGKNQRGKKKYEMEEKCIMDKQEQRQLY